MDNLAQAHRPSPEDAKLALRQFRIIFNAVGAHFRSVERSLGLGGAQVWALSLVKERPDLQIRELAQAMDIHPSTASNLARALVKQKLIGTSRNQADRRIVQLHLLTSGEELLSKAPKPYAGVLPAALERLDMQTLNEINLGLSKLVDSLHSANATTPGSESIPLASNRPRALPRAISRANVTDKHQQGTRHE